MNTILSKIDQENQKQDFPNLKVGDTVKVHVKIIEGSKHRIQVFAGTIIARDGHGSTETITVRRISYGEGVERVFPIHSPNIEKFEIERSSKVRRAKLYYLRNLTGKKARLKEAQRPKGEKDKKSK